MISKLKSWTAYLQDLTTSGMGLKTAKAEKVPLGPEGSTIVAVRDWARLEAFKQLFLDSANLWEVPAALLAGICSRETHGKSVVGDKGNGIGLMQIDKRSHKFARSEEALTPDKNIDVGAAILSTYLYQLSKDPKKKEWQPVYLLKGAVAAYNSGVKNIVTIERMDVGTTGGDYSSDVWERAKALIPYFKSEPLKSV
jgi:soluble lytic murein transglycosylase-like protein